jgi:Meckel syndrome type 1 protein
MKTLKMFSLVMAVAFVAAAQMRAGETAAANPYFGTLSSIGAAELPAKSAELVSQADSKNRAEATVNVVKAAVGLNPAAAAAIVGTIAQSTPEMAPVAAATAAALVPSQAVAIARAAAAAAPAEAGKIVEAVCRVVPAAYKEVANAVAGVVPGAGKAILDGVSAAIPSLQSPISKVVAASGGVNPSVSDVLGQVSSASGVSTPAAITPAVHFGPPYVAPPASPVPLNAGSGGEVPVGGRNYSAPPPP